MTGLPTPIYETSDDRRLGVLSAVAETLGVRPQQVDAWARRRHVNGCPEPVSEADRPPLGATSAVWFDIDEWRAWRLTYDPQHGVPVRARSTDPNRGGPAAVARRLGVRTKDVSRWISRRASNHCPEPGADGLYDLTQWETWHPAYAAARASWGDYTREHIRDADRTSAA